MPRHLPQLASWMHALSLLPHNPAQKPEKPHNLLWAVDNYGRAVPVQTESDKTRNSQSARLGIILMHRMKFPIIHKDRPYMQLCDSRIVCMCHTKAPWKSNEHILQSAWPSEFYITVSSPGFDKYVWSCQYGRCNISDSVGATKSGVIIRFMSQEHDKIDTTHDIHT